MSSLTIAQMRQLLGLPDTTPDADVLAAWEASGLDNLYLTQEEYIERFGTQETTFITDESKSGQPDSLKVETAIRDATEVVDGYIGIRYPRPIRDVPRLLKSIVAALAREALFTNKPTPMVTANADRARAQLKDIQAGRLTLPIEADQVAPVQSSAGFAASSGDGNRNDGFSGQLDRYSNIEAGCFVPCWRR